MKELIDGLDAVRVFVVLDLARLPDHDHGAAELAGPVVVQMLEPLSATPQRAKGRLAAKPPRCRW